MKPRVAWLGALLALAALDPSSACGAGLLPGATLLSSLQDQGPDARSLGMGSALMGLAPEAAAQLWNPAGLAGLAAPQASLHHHSWLADIYQESVAWGTPLSGSGALGLSFHYTGFGTFERRNSQGSVSGSLEARRYGGGLCWAQSFGTQLALGLNAKAARQDLGDWAQNVVAADLGAIVRPTGLKPLSIGISFGDLGIADSGATLAAKGRLAAAWDQPLGGGAKLLFAAGGLWVPGGVNRLNVGLEGGMDALYFVRAGYQAKLADNTLGGLDGFSAGLGLAVGGLRLDYAWLPYGELGTSHRISLNYAFAPPKPPPSKRHRTRRAKK